MNTKTIVLGGGCFWCLDALYQQVRGITKVVVGYAGGDHSSPTYEQHGSHAEVVELSYDPEVITLETILEIFFHIHDPTTLNRQGNDVGTQYRSIILCTQDEIETATTARAEAQKVWDNPIVTEIQVLATFYPAEEYHQDYFTKNPANAYCQIVINPKLDKFRHNFESLLK